MILDKIGYYFNTVATYDKTRSIQSCVQTDTDWEAAVNRLDALLCSLGFVRQFTKYPLWTEDRNYYMAIGAFRYVPDEHCPELLIFHELRDTLQTIECTEYTQEKLDEFIYDIEQHLLQYKLQNT